MGAFFSQSRYDAIREVAVQLSGERHDGLSLDWSVRAGVKVKPVDEREPRGARWLRGWPHFVGLKPTRSFNSGRGRTSHLHTDPTAIGLRREAEQPGYLRNIGAGGLALYDCRLGSSPEDREFIWYFYLRGVRYSLDGLTEALPLVLRPSETLWIMTLFMPTYLVSPSTTGFVRLFTNDPHTPQAVVATNGQALEAMPAGRWEPGMLDFGNVRVLVAASSVARLLSTGTTPLVASNVRFGRPSPALTFEVRPNLGEDGLVIRVTYRPTAVDDTLSPNLDRLIADTNAGELVLPLTGTAVA
jgi:hypothetical protein